MTARRMYSDAIGLYVDCRYLEVENLHHARAGFAGSPLIVGQQSLHERLHEKVAVLVTWYWALYDYSHGRRPGWNVRAIAGDLVHRQRGFVQDLPYGRIACPGWTGAPLDLLVVEVGVAGCIPAHHDGCYLSQVVLRSLHVTLWIGRRWCSLGDQLDRTPCID